MPRSNILVVVVDGLRASALGAYGNTSFPTPALDRFATDSLLFDWCYAPAADLADIYRALWQATHPARTLNINPQSISRPAGAAPQSSLPDMLADFGYQTTLVTDEPQLTLLAGATSFHDCVQLANAWDSLATTVRADNISQTELARVFAAASEVIDRHLNGGSDPAAKPQLVWVHARGLYGLWDAPLELQGSLLDDDDPPAVESIMPPDFVMKPDDDPDVAFRYGCAYAAQTIVLDACWKGLLSAFESDERDDSWLVMLVGARGYPLGEHRRVGGVDSRLYAEQLHVPWLVRFPDLRGRLARSSALASHLDVLPTLLDWIDGAANPALLAFDGQSALSLMDTRSSAARDAILSANAAAYSIRTAAWCLREDSSRADAASAAHKESFDRTASFAELYVRPDDRWEANDISKLCSDVVEELQAAATETLRCLSLGESMPRAILPLEAGTPPA